MLPLVNETSSTDAAHMRSLLTSGRASPDVFRAALAAIQPRAWDAWIDRIFEIDQLPEDVPLPPGCVPYLPCSGETLLRVVEHADVQSADTFVDVGAGLGRAALIVHFASGASVIGLELQAALVRSARALFERFNARGASMVEGDAVENRDVLRRGSVFFLYCPFSGQRLEKLLGELASIARERPIRICCVDLPVLSAPWLKMVFEAKDLAVYRASR